MRIWKFARLSNAAFDSRIKSSEVKRTEQWLGYFLGPALVANLYACVSGSYLNSFYTDVLHLNSLAAGAFLTLMPIISKVIDAITNIVMGMIVDNTHSRQGKARPWILVSGPLMLISGILLFAVPNSTAAIRAVWVTCTYNLYFSVSYTIYNLSNVITLPLSTRDGKKRDSLAMAQSMGINMVPGAILAVVFPSFILPYMGVDQSRWITVMAAVSVLGFLGTLIQFYFTKERVTEERVQTAQTASIDIRAQVRGCLASKYWVMIVAVIFMHKLTECIQVNAMLYYANWVVGTYNDGVTLSLLNILGQSLLGPGVLIIWPCVKKLGKQKVYIIFGVIAVIGGLAGLFVGKSLAPALVALTIRSIGLLPMTYITLSLLSDALDHVEWKCGYRCDGFSSAIYSIIITVTAGLGLGCLNLGLSQTGYVPPLSDGSWVAQSAGVQNFLTFCVFGVPAIAMAVMVVIFFKFDLEKKLPEIHRQIHARNGEMNQ